MKSKLNSKTTKNKGGRPATRRREREADAVLKEVLREAKGDPIKVMQLMLEHGDRLHLDVNTVLKMARDLAPYEKPKLASIEQKTIDLGAPTIVFERADDKIKRIEGVILDEQEEK